MKKLIIIKEGIIIKKKIIKEGLIIQKEIIIK